MRAASLLALLVCLQSCSRSDEEAHAAAKPLELPARQDPERPDPWTDAIQVWRLGERYLEKPSERMAIPVDRYEITFSGIDADAHEFLKYANLKPAVQFSCVVTLHPYEDALEAELKEGSGVFQLQALVLLMRAYAPASVDLQWNALQQLKGLPGKPGLRELLGELEGRFSEAVLAGALEHPFPEDRYRHDPFLSWNVRAAGVVRSRRALPTLVRLSRSDHLDTSLAAERSLEDFDGPEADEALAQCLLGWQYNAYIRAGHALLKRNKALLVRTLQRAAPPEQCRRWQGILLARADEPDAVPILCEAIPKTSVIDRDMFDDIDRLAREQDLPLVRMLVHRVRPEQEERARRLEADLVRRFSGR